MILNQASLKISYRLEKSSISTLKLLHCHKFAARGRLSIADWEVLRATPFYNDNALLFPKQISTQIIDSKTASGKRCDERVIETNIMK